MHHYATNMWCEQYIECIINIWHLKKKSLHLGRNWHVLHISNHFSTLIDICIFQCVMNICWTFNENYF